MQVVDEDMRHNGRRGRIFIVDSRDMGVARNGVAFDPSAISLRFFTDPPDRETRRSLPGIHAPEWIRNGREIMWYADRLLRKVEPTAEEAAEWLAEEMLNELSR